MKKYTTKFMRKLLALPLLIAALFTNMDLAFCQQVTDAHIIEINQQKNSLDEDDSRHAVSDTAYITLYWLASSGNAKAKLLLEQADKELLAKLVNANGFDKIKLVNKEYQKVRHDSLNSYVLDNHYPIVIDLACGYSPRGLELSEAQITYIGGDFSSVIQGMQDLTDRYASASQKPYLKYRVIDVTNQEQMLEAVKDIKEPVCIMTEGLFMYLDQSQATAAIKNIGVILKNKGGCFITQDFSTKEFVTAVAEALYPYEGKRLYKESADIYNNTSAGIMDMGFGEMHADIRSIIKKAGLHYRKIPINGKKKQSNIECLDAEQEKRLQKVMAKKYMWIVMR